MRESRSTYTGKRDLLPRNLILSMIYQVIDIKSSLHFVPDSLLLYCIWTQRHNF